MLAVYRYCLVPGLERDSRKERALAVLAVLARSRRLAPRLDYYAAWMLVLVSSAKYLHVPCRAEADVVLRGVDVDGVLRLLDDVVACYGQRRLTGHHHDVAGARQLDVAAEHHYLAAPCVADYDASVLSDVHSGAALVELLELDGLVAVHLGVVLVSKRLQIYFVRHVVIGGVGSEAVHPCVLVLEVVRLPVEKLKLPVAGIVFIMLERLQDLGLLLDVVP